MITLKRHKFRVGLVGLALILFISLVIMMQPPADPFAANAVVVPINPMNRTEESPGDRRRMHEQETESVI